MWDEESFCHTVTGTEAVGSCEVTITFRLYYVPLLYIHHHECLTSGLDRTFDVSDSEHNNYAVFCVLNCTVLAAAGFDFSVWPSSSFSQIQKESMKA